MNRRAAIFEIVLVGATLALLAAEWIWIVRVIAHYLRCPYVH
jgi:hypothetical protein